MITELSKELEEQVQNLKEEKISREQQISQLQEQHKQEVQQLTE